MMQKALELYDDVYPTRIIDNILLAPKILQHADSSLSITSPYPNYKTNSVIVQKHDISYFLYLLMTTLFLYIIFALIDSPLYI